ncbi:MAG: pyridoxal-phosphate dependent enzyme [Chloroflexota bacterium]
MADFSLECLDCGQRAAGIAPGKCPNCGSEWQQARYDYPSIAAAVESVWPNRPFNLWRYRDLLPIRDSQNIVSLGEGGSPLIHGYNLSLMLGRPNIYFKDERQGPTGSFKDRQAALAVSAMKESGITEAVVASTGNVAISYSAYCARAGIKLWAFLTSMVPPDKMREVALYGTQVIKVTGTYDRAKEVAAEFAAQRNLYYDRGARNIAALESMKTIAFELAEQLPRIIASPTATLRPTTARWRAPDWYIQSVSGGLGPLGVAKGFWELNQLGLIDRVPKIAVIQVEGCAPMVNSFRAGLETAEPVPVPRTHIATLSTGQPGRAYTLLRKQLLRFGGIMESVTDEEAFRAMHVAAKMEGLAIEPAAAVAFAGLFKLVRASVIGRDEVVVVNATGHTIPVEREVLGEGWSKILSGESVESTPKPQAEGLLAALDRLDEQVRRIAIIEDNPDAARLVRRILQARGNYVIDEASDGVAGLALIQDTHPDLVILDLMMPEMDGFQLLDKLRGDKATRKIPVIVITAKELTREDRQRLSGQIDGLLQKGKFMDEDLLVEITEALTR